MDVKEKGDIVLSLSFTIVKSKKAKGSRWPRRQDSF